MIPKAKKMNIAPLLDYFAGIIALDEAEATALEAGVQEKQVKRRQFILQQGDVCQHYNFVVSGCFKMYKVDSNAEEHNLQFAIENGWIADIGSFHTGQPSELYIEALEPATVLQISKEGLLYLYTNHPKFERIFRVLMENAFVALQKRVLQNIGATAEERYVDFMHNHRQLFNRLSNVQIASYIGVTPEFLSKIRKKLATR